MSNFKPKVGLSSNLNSLPIEEGSLIITLDDQKIYLDTDTSRVSLGAASSFSSDYNDLINKPTIPTKTSELTNDSSFVTSDDATQIAQAKAQGVADQLATVATTGFYADLLNKPSIPEMQCGYLGGLSAKANAVTEGTITFPTAFSSQPRVVATMYSGTTNVNHAKVQLIVYSITKTSFKYRFINSYTSAFSPAIEWIAMATNTGAGSN